MRVIGQMGGDDIKRSWKRKLEPDKDYELRYARIGILDGRESLGKSGGTSRYSIPLSSLITVSQTTAGMRPEELS